MNSIINIEKQDLPIYNSLQPLINSNVSQNTAINQNILINKYLQCSTNQKSLLPEQTIQKNKIDEEKKQLSSNESKKVKIYQSKEITTYNFDVNMWLISLLSIILTILIIVLLVYKWNDNDY